MSGVVSSSTVEGTGVITNAKFKELTPGDEATQWPTTNGMNSVFGSGMASPFSKFGSEILDVSPDSTALQIKKEATVDTTR